MTVNAKAESKYVFRVPVVDLVSWIRSSFKPGDEVPPNPDPDPVPDPDPNPNPTPTPNPNPNQVRLSYIGLPPAYVPRPNQETAARAFELSTQACSLVAYT